MLVPRIITGHLAGMRQLNSAVDIFIRLDPFSPLLESNHADIIKFNTHTLPSHTR